MGQILDGLQKVGAWMPIACAILQDMSPLEYTTLIKEYLLMREEPTTKFSDRGMTEDGSRGSSHLAIGQEET